MDLWSFSTVSLNLEKLKKRHFFVVFLGKKPLNK
jgi:hypothetical protein